jgi:hypothetical protein
MQERGYENKEARISGIHFQVEENVYKSLYKALHEAVLVF